jgi:hypothetical protein
VIENEEISFTQPPRADTIHPMDSQSSRGFTRRAAHLVTSTVPSFVAAVVAVTSGYRRTSNAVESVTPPVEPEPEPEVVAFVHTLPRLRDAIERRERGSDQLNAQVNCGVCWDSYCEGDLILLHDEYEGQHGSLVMHGLCSTCMSKSLSLARRRRRAHLCPFCRETCSPPMALDVSEEENTAINLT